AGPAGPAAPGATKFRYDAAPSAGGSPRELFAVGGYRVVASYGRRSIGSGVAAIVAGSTPVTIHLGGGAQAIAGQERCFASGHYL
ncbi:MAG: hypothetical protein ACRDL0_07385, partial [Thermoleophilaceae bacterium]